MANLKNNRWLYLLVNLLIVGLIWYSLRHSLANPEPKQVPYSEFLTDIRTGHVSDVRIDQTNLVGTLKPEAAKKNEPHEISTERLPGIDETSLLKDLEDQHVRFSGHVDQSGWWGPAFVGTANSVFRLFIWVWHAQACSGAGKSDDVRQEPSQDSRSVYPDQREF